MLERVIPCVRVLLGAGADVNIPGKSKPTTPDMYPLDRASFLLSDTLVGMLLEAGARVRPHPGGDGHRKAE